MIAIYQSLLRRLQTNFSHIKYITDKSDNAGCYLESNLATKNSNISFTETIFKEQQSGKDQCDTDSATAKCQVNIISKGEKTLKHLIVGHPPPSSPY